MDIVYIQEENAKLRDELAHLKAELATLKEENTSLIIKLKEEESRYLQIKHSKDKDTTELSATSKRFKMVTVLFMSVRGISKLSDQNTSRDLIDELDRFFLRVDEITARYNIQKIKAIGDSYILAGGIPRKNRTNPYEIVLAALEIRRYLDLVQHSAKDDNLDIWDISVGIHTGPVTATITGTKKISYDLKGDAVNIASRIEASNTTGKIMISETSYEFVREFFECVDDGAMPVKYMGAVKLYDVVGFRPKYSDDPELMLPNAKFKLAFGFIRYDDLEEYILNRLENELPNHLYYHNVKHTMDVAIGVEVIGTAEGVTKEELLLLKTAGLFHDMGQIVQSKGHEEISCKYAHDILPNFGYNKDQIHKICEIIMATQLPPNPKTNLERIICDADLDYLGRRDFIPVSDTLFEELKVQNIITDFNEWNKLQIKFISGHKYFTNFAQENREVNKQEQIERLKTLVKE